ncbi:MAG: hypothetical protein C5B54_02120 [Acidobacteria bacterium]|nr:MAG: hypothetical protein C5B54_02120 [Acidobacteriota bacterium]
MFKKLTNYFFRGLIFLAPIALTLYVFYIAFIKIDRWIHLPIPGAGFIIAIAGVTFLGFLTSNFLTRSIFHLIENLLARLPFVKLLHSSIKDVLTAFVGEKSKFDKPVVVEVFPGSSIRALGFITRESMEEFDLLDSAAVYFPQSFNFAGNLLIYPRERITLLRAESSRLMAFIVSGGITT